MSLLLALSGHDNCPDECLLSGVKRTSTWHRSMSVIDPKRTCVTLQALVLRWVSRLGVENVKHRTIGCHSSRTPGDGCCQQPFKFLQVIKFSPNVVEVMRSNLTDLTTRRLFGSTKPQQRAYLVEREAQLTRPADKAQKAKVSCLVNATATWRARWCRKHLDPFVV